MTSSNSSTNPSIAYPPGVAMRPSWNARPLHTAASILPDIRRDAVREGALAAALAPGPSRPPCALHVASPPSVRAGRAWWASAVRSAALIDATREGDVATASSRLGRLRPESEARRGTTRGPWSTRDVRRDRAVTSGGLAAGASRESAELRRERGGARAGPAGWDRELDARSWASARACGVRDSGHGDGAGATRGVPFHARLLFMAVVRSSSDVTTARESRDAPGWSRLGSLLPCVTLRRRTSTAGDVVQCERSASSVSEMGCTAPKEQGPRAVRSRGGAQPRRARWQQTEAQR